MEMFIMITKYNIYLTSSIQAETECNLALPFCTIWALNGLDGTCPH